MRPKLYWMKPCEHGSEEAHQDKPDPNCSQCKGQGWWTGVSGSDAYSTECACLNKCYGGHMVPWKPWTGGDPS